jgi:hypothetical protein
VSLLIEKNFFETRVSLNVTSVPDIFGGLGIGSEDRLKL